MDWFELAEDLKEPLGKGQFDKCIERVSEVIRGMPNSPFHLVLNVDFNNDPNLVALHFDKFVTIATHKISLAAIYVEMNGFYINPDRWYFDIFGYEHYGGNNNYDWLSEWDSEDKQSLTLTGMEQLQKVYSDFATDTDSVRGYCDLMVVIRFQQLISRSAKYMQKITVPILATAHDYDFIYESHHTDK